MAQRTQKDFFTRLADAGEEAIQRLAGTPGADRVLGVVTTMRDQLDWLSRRVRGIEELEKRVARLEKRIDALSKPARKRTTAAKPRTTTRARSTSKKKS